MKTRHLKEFLVSQEGVNLGQGSGSRNDCTLPPPLGVIKVIYATSRGISLNSRKGVLSVVSPPKANVMDRPKKRTKRISAPITFSETDLKGMS